MGINQESSEWDALWELCLEARRYDHLSCYSFGESSELLLTSPLTVHPSCQCAHRIEDKLIINWIQKETAEPAHRRRRHGGIPPPISGLALRDSAPKCSHADLCPTLRLHCVRAISKPLGTLLVFSQWQPGSPGTNVNKRQEPTRDRSRWRSDPASHP